MAMSASHLNENHAQMQALPWRIFFW